MLSNHRETSRCYSWKEAQMSFSNSRRTCHYSQRSEQYIFSYVCKRRKFTLAIRCSFFGDVCLRLRVHFFPRKKGLALSTSHVGEAERENNFERNKLRLQHLFLFKSRERESTTCSSSRHGGKKFFWISDGTGDSENIIPSD